MRKDFAVFILSNGRSQHVKTYEALLENNYTGDWFVVVDDLDEEMNRYISNFGESKVIVFDKKKYAYSVDYMTNNGKLNSVVYARNAVYDIAEEMGYKNFIVMDDDITNIKVRYVEEGTLKGKDIKNFDRFFDLMFRYSDEVKAESLSIGMQGDFIGGMNNKVVKSGYQRRCFGLFFLNTERRVEFKGLANEDLNASLLAGSVGGIWMSILKAQLFTVDSGQDGGMTDFYMESDNKYQQHS